jgi:4-amino-4-deoxy-L-arabinose transferase-like glycosyltransferase
MVMRLFASSKGEAMSESTVTGNKPEVLEWRWTLSRSDWLRGAVLVLVSGLVGLAGLVLVKGQLAVDFYRESAYWFYVVLTLLWGYCFSREWSHLQTAARDWRRKDWWLITAVLAVTIWLGWGLQEGGLRIVADDTLQVQTSRQLFLEQEAAVSNRAHLIGRIVTDLHLNVDKRPAYFPWVVAQLHAVLGYRFENAVLASRLSLLGLAVLLFLIGRRLHRTWGGLLLPLLVLCNPLVVHHANGAGFEVFNLMLIALAWWATLLAWERPSTTSIALAALSGVMLAHARYESMLFLLPVSIALLLAWIRARRILIHWMLFVAPVLLLPRLWLQHIFDNERNWQLYSKPEAAGGAFSLRYVYENVGRTLSFFFSTNSWDGNAPLVFIVGVLGAGFWLMALWKRRRVIWEERSADIVHYLFWGGLTLHFGLMMVYFWGHFDDLATQRLAIPEMLWLAVPVVGVLGYLRVSDRVWKIALLVFGSHLLFFTAPLLARNDLLSRNRPAATQNALLRWQQANPVQSRLVISNYVGRVFLALGVPATAPAALLNRREDFRFHWELRSFDEIIVAQRWYFDPRTREWIIDPNDDLGPDFVLVDVWQERESPTSQMKLRRLIGLRHEHPDWKPEEWSPQRADSLHGARREFEQDWVKRLP